MTFKNTNVSMDAAGTITMIAGGATVTIAKSGAMTMDSPTGIKLECGASSLLVSPGGVTLASRAFTVAGTGSKLSMDEAAAILSGKVVTIEASGVASIKGKSKLGLQESESGKDKTKSNAAGPDADTDAADPIVFRGRVARKPEPGAYASEGKQALQEGRDSIVVKAVNARGEPIARRRLKITTPSGTVVESRTAGDGTMTVSGIAKGKCKIEWLGEP